MASEKTLALRAIEQNLATRERPLPTKIEDGGDAVLLHPIDHRNRAARRADRKREKKGGVAMQKLASVTGHNERTAVRLGPLDAFDAFKAGKISRAHAESLGAFDRRQRIAHRIERLKREKGIATSPIAAARAAREAREQQQAAVALSSEQGEQQQPEQETST